MRQVLTLSRIRNSKEQTGNARPTQEANLLGLWAWSDWTSRLIHIQYVGQCVAMAGQVSTVTSSLGTLRSVLLTVWVVEHLSTNGSEVPIL